MTVRSIVTKAFRESGLVPVGGEPEAEEFEEGLDHLNMVIQTLFGHDLGESLEDFYSPYWNENEDFPENSRLVLNDTDKTQIQLTEYPSAGARLSIIDNMRGLSTYPLTIDGNGRKIDGGDVATLSTEGARVEYFYRDDLGEWVKISNLTADDESPFPPEFDLLLITLLAYRLNPRYGAQSSDSTIETLKTVRSQFRARYKQSKEKDSELGLLNLSHNNKRGVSFTNFNTGH